jgi:type II secretory pathway pseudopilin PulG
MALTMRPFRQNPRRGSALLASMIVVVVLSFAAAGVLSYSLTTYRNSVRQTLLDQAKEVADSEMENLFYTWKSALLLRQAVANAQYEPPLSTLCASTNTHPFAAALTSSDPSKPVWAITRAIAFAPIANTPAGGASGIVPGTLNIGTNYYYTAKTSASTSSALFGTITYHSGRNFVYSSTSLFQFAVFYQGNLEIAAGGAMTINGPISTNASAYMGSQTGFTLTISDNGVLLPGLQRRAGPPVRGNRPPCGFRRPGRTRSTTPNPDAPAPADNRHGPAGAPGRQELLAVQLHRRRRRGHRHRDVSRGLSRTCRVSRPERGLPGRHRPAPRWTTRAT